MDKGLMSWESLEKLGVAETRGARGKEVQVRLQREGGGDAERGRHHACLTGP